MAWLALALLMLPTDALAQQRTSYGGDGKVIGRESTGTNCASTLYGADGRVLSRTTSSSSGTTTVYGADGRRTGTVTAQQKREGR